MSAILSIGAAILAGCLAVACIAFRRWGVAGWSFAVGMALLAGESVCAWLSASATDWVQAARWQYYRLGFSSLIPGTWLLFSLTYSRGNYAVFVRQWRFVLGAAFLMPVLLVLGFEESLMIGVGKPEGTTTWFIATSWPGRVFHMLMLIGSVLVLMNLERTYRTAVGVMRWRIKFAMLGLGLLFGARVYTSSQGLLFSGIATSMAGIEAGALVLACGLIATSVARSGIVEIDVYPSQAVIHQSLTVLLVGVYLFVVGLLAQVVSALGGDIDFPLKALFILLAMAALALVLASDRVRQYSMRFVSRHFRRPLHDYRKVWTAFTERATSRVDRTDLCREVVALVAETFNVLSATVWLVDLQRNRLVFGASTSLTEQKAVELLGDQRDLPALLAFLKQKNEPVDIDMLSEPCVELLKRCNPDHFGKGGNRVCVPLIAAGEVQSLITLADRVSGVRFSIEDYELLKCIGDQVAANLRNIQLSERLLESKQLEAFQAMSAFLVHDLKNTASALSLTLRNLPVHFNDPAFREDALRAIGKAVDHINGLISRLTSIKEGLRINSVEGDLNQLVAKTLESLGTGTAGDVEVVTDLSDLPKLSFDPEQIKKVLINLLLNAKEAVGAGGRIEVSTASRNGWAVVTVADNGCGMSPEFLDRCLFRPFQTTKKKGLGIGMFQSRMIVEAHRGRLEVESEQNKGTVFKVLLPLNRPAQKMESVT